MNLIEMHSSWLAVNSIIGCPNACKYCFLQDEGNNTCLPKILNTPENIVKELLSFKYYDSKLPVCLFPNTDIFLNDRTINYLIETLDELIHQNVKNDIVLITKLKIPDYIIKKLKSIKEKGINIIVYLSYSGLGKEIEPNINIEDIKENFKNLYENGIKTIHYYRPFMKKNSSKEKIKEVLNYVNKYTNISVTTGLMKVPSILEFWKELKNEDENTLKNAISIWPEEAWNYFYKEYDSKGYFYQTNTCALKTAFKNPSPYYGTHECKNYNHCSKEQRRICRINSYKRLNKRKILKELDNLLINLGINTKDYCYKYDRKKGIELYGILLDIKTLAYLTNILGIKVSIPKYNETHEKYNSTLNGSKPFIVGGSYEKNN